MLKIIKNPDVELYNEISQAVKDNDGFCPCMLEKSVDTKCPCKMFREQNVVGNCHCGRFFKVDYDHI